MTESEKSAGQFIEEAGLQLERQRVEKAFEIQMNKVTYWLGKLEENLEFAEQEVNNPKFWYPFVNLLAQRLAMFATKDFFVRARTMHGPAAQVGQEYFERLAFFKQLSPGLGNEKRTELHQDASQRFAVVAARLEKLFVATQKQTAEALQHPLREQSQDIILFCHTVAAVWNSLDKKTKNGEDMQFSINALNRNTIFGVLWTAGGENKPDTDIDPVIDAVVYALIPKLKWQGKYSITAEEVLEVLLSDTPLQGETKSTFMEFLHA
jgi:hypothetical protein